MRGEAKVILCCFVVFILAINVEGGDEVEGGGRWIKWDGLEADFSRQKGYIQSYGSYFEASRSGRWVVQVWSGVRIVKGKARDPRFDAGKGMRAIEPRVAVVWEVGEDGRLMRRVWSSEGENFYVVDVEWIKDDLLISVLPGVRHSEEVGIEDWPLWQVFVLKPSAWKMERFTQFAADRMLSSDRGDKVLLRNLEKFGEGENEEIHLHIKIFSYPEGDEISSFRFKEALRDFGVYFGEKGTLLGWPDDEHIWAIGKQEGPLLFGTPEQVPVLFNIDLKGNVKLWSGKPKTCWLLLKNDVTLPGDSGGLIVHTMLPQILQDGRAVVVLAPGPRLGFFSMHQLRKEYWFEPKMYPKELKRILRGPERRGASVLAITVDGKRLVLREGGSGVVWAWDLETNKMEKLAKVGYVKKVFGWLKKDYLMVEVERSVMKEGKRRPVLEYGVIHVKMD